MSNAGFDIEATQWPIRLVPHARARRLRLAWDPVRAEFRLTLPRRCSEKKALQWAHDQRDWAARQVSAARAEIRVTPGAVIPFCGRDLAIEWDRARPRAPVLDGDILAVGGPEDAVTRRVEAWVKARARDVMTRETSEYCTAAGLSCTSVSIGDPRSRWGSCSSSGAIRYNWRLVMAPEFVRRATVAHEVAHLAHMNHGPRFYALLAHLFEGDADEARGWLRAHGQSLRLVRFS